MLEEIVWSEWSKSLYIILAGILVQQFWKRVFFSYLHKYLEKKNPRGYMLLLLNLIEKPLSFMILATAFYLACQHIPFKLVSDQTLRLLYRSAIIITFFNLLYNIGDNSRGHLTNVLKRIDVNLDPLLLNLLSSLIRVLTLILGFLTLAKEWGYDTTSLIAGLGLGGLALAMASKDSLSNIFGGFVILLDKPFSIGDSIQASGMSGSVEEVSFRSTRIRTLENDLVYIPNSNLTNISITNMSRRFKQQTQFTIGLSYSTTKQQLQQCIDEIETLLKGMEGKELTQGDSIVSFSSYGESSLNIYVIYYTIITNSRQYNKIKEKINFAILDIVEKVGTSMAFPSQSVYFENALYVDNQQKQEDKIKEL